MTLRSTDLTKRVIDLGVGSALLIATAPLQLMIAAAIRVRLGAPVLFRQVRPGLHAQPFALVKFRTMRESDDAGTSDADRLIPLGRLLRATSLDELPTLWNVVRGDMSLVGPRPLLMEYLPLYTERQARRHEVRPGITGLAQVNGRNALPWAERFELDVKYVESRSLLLDLRILCLTVAKVVKREGVSAPGHATMYPFSAPTAP